MREEVTSGARARPSVGVRLYHGLWIAVALVGWGVFIHDTFPVRDLLMIDFTQYYDAARAVAADASPYRVEARQHSPAAFLLPPVFAIALRPLAALPVDVANDVWFVLSLMFLAAGCVATVRLVGLARWLSPLSMAMSAVFISAVLLLPVWTGARLGQITALLFCLSVGGLALQQANRPVLGGVLLGIAIAFKLYPGALAAFAIWVGWRRFGYMAIIVAVTLHAVSAISYWAIFAEYWSSTLFQIPDHSYAVNLSLMGMAGRAPAESGLMLRTLAFLLSGLMMLLPFLATWREHDGRSVSLALSLLIAATVTAAPLVEHHYMIWLIVPIWIVAAALGERQDVVGLVLLGGAFVLLSQPYRLVRGVLAMTAAQGDSERLGEGVLVAGGLLIYGLVAAEVLRHRRDRSTRRRAAPVPLVP
jgi:hypothetical protein